MARLGQMDSFPANKMGSAIPAGKGQIRNLNKACVGCVQAIVRGKGCSLMGMLTLSVLLSGTARSMPEPTFCLRLKAEPAGKQSLEFLGRPGQSETKGFGTRGSLEVCLYCQGSQEDWLKR